MACQKSWPGELHAKKDWGRQENEMVQLVLSNYMVPMACPSCKSSDGESAHASQKVMSSIESRKTQDRKRTIWIRIGLEQISEQNRYLDKAKVEGWLHADNKTTPHCRSLVANRIRMYICHPWIKPDMVLCAPEIQLLILWVEFLKPVCILSRGSRNSQLQLCWHTHFSWESIFPPGFDQG